MNPPTNNLIVFSDDWGRHPSSCQHLVSQFLPRYRVTWINTIGMRRPQLNWLTARRGFEKVQKWRPPIYAPQRQINAGNPVVLDPLMWPWIRTRFDRQLNRWLLTRTLQVCRQTVEGTLTAITTLPITAGIMKDAPVDRWVYYCVDDFSLWPGLEGATLRQMEQDVVQAADVVIAASLALTQRLESYGRRAELLTHGVDIQHWRTDAAVEPLQTKQFERPLIVFWGLLDRRMDLEFLDRLSRDLKKGTILLVGPQCDPDPKLTAIERVFSIGPVAYENLAAVAREAAVLVMPYQDVPVTRAMQPLKMLEYLATDKPVVVRDLPATSSWSDCLDCVSDADGFSERVRLRLVTGLLSEQRNARLRIASESWPVKAAQFEQMIFSKAASSDHRLFAPGLVDA